jgi:hypothetical protein
LEEPDVGKSPTPRALVAHLLDPRDALLPGARQQRLVRHGREADNGPISSDQLLPSAQCEAAAERAPAP